MLSVKRKLWLKEAVKPYLKPALVWFRSKRAQSETSFSPNEGTHYYETIDKNKLKALRHYELAPSSLSLEDVYYNVNYNFYSAYGPNFKLKDCLALSVDCPLDYRRLLSELKHRLPNLESNTFAHYLPNRKLREHEIACVIRHDVDGDLVAATQLAEIERSLGYKSSYYILHTAPYYGTFNNDGKFIRNDECISSYQKIQSLGHEIALHTDGMLIYQEYKRDGAQCLKDEITWLRKNDIELVGTTAHNSWPSYGVENFTIFEGKDRGKGAGMRAVSHNGKWAPLGILNEKSMNITYEANELLWQSTTPLFYAALRSQNVWRISLYNYSKELINYEYPFGRLADFNNKFVSTDELLELVDTIVAPAYLYLVVHPMHYGLRANHDESPWLPNEPVEDINRDTSRWAGYNEGEEHLVCAISVLNELETYDRGIDCYQSASQKILSLGSSNIATNKISADSKYSQVTAQQVSRLSNTPRTAAISYAVNSPSLISFKAAYEKVLKHGAPDYIIVGIDSQNREFQEIINWAERISGQTKKVIILVENASKLDLQNNSRVNKGVIAKINIFVPDIFNKYLGSTSLFREGNEGIWSPQGHYLVGREICNQISQFISH